MMLLKQHFRGYPLAEVKVKMSEAGPDRQKLSQCRDAWTNYV